MKNTFGNNISLTLFGESHGEAIGAVLDGVAPGIAVDESEIARYLTLRRPSGAISTARAEADEFRIVSGVVEGYTTGAPICITIPNADTRSRDYSMTADLARPGHADYAADQKYRGYQDFRGGGHFSGRLTAPMCIAGGICLQILEKQGVNVGAHLYSVGKENDTPFDPVSVSTDDFELIKSREIPVLGEDSHEKIKAEIAAAKADGDSVGAVIECAVTGLPAGLGEHIFDGVENRISQIVFGIPAVKGIEFGNGFECARMSGSQNNDPFFTDGKNIYTKTNNCGGILGGMTNGMPVIFRAAMKPTPSIFSEQDSVDMNTMTNVKLSIKGRHDPCVALRAVPVFEAAAAIAIYDMILDK